MCDPAVINRLFSTIIHEDMVSRHVSSDEIRIGIQNMKEVYSPNPNSLTAPSVDVADFNDPAHRIAYLHKYAPFHVSLVSEMFQRALQNSNIFKNSILNSNCLNMCCLGGGPGSDVLGVLCVLNQLIGLFRVSITIIDIMAKWNETFASIVEELRYGSYGPLGEIFSEQYFDWKYIGHNLLSKMDGQVNKAIACASLLTMVKFVSAAACKDTTNMIRRIFNTMKPGSLLLYIDNAGGGFHKMMEQEADVCGMLTVYALRHEPYEDQSFNVKRFGYTPCLQTKVSVHVWRKKGPLPISNFVSLPLLQEAATVSPVRNSNQTNKRSRSKSRTRTGKAVQPGGDSAPARSGALTPSRGQTLLQQQQQTLVYSQALYSGPGSGLSTMERYILERTVVNERLPRPSTANQAYWNVQSSQQSWRSGTQFPETPSAQSGLSQPQPRAISAPQPAAGTMRAPSLAPRSTHKSRTPRSGGQGRKANPLGAPRAIQYQPMSARQQPTHGDGRGYDPDGNQQGPDDCCGCCVIS